MSYQHRARCSGYHNKFVVAGCQLAPQEHLAGDGASPGSSDCLIQRRQHRPALPASELDRLELALRTRPENILRVCRDSATMDDHLILNRTRRTGSRPALRHGLGSHRNLTYMHRLSSARQAWRGTAAMPLTVQTKFSAGLASAIEAMTLSW